MALEWFRENGRSMIEFMEVRMAIEPMAVRLAIPRATDSDIEALEKRIFFSNRLLMTKTQSNCSPMMNFSTIKLWNLLIIS